MTDFKTPPIPKRAIPKRAISRRAMVTGLGAMSALPLLGGTAALAQATNAEPTVVSGPATSHAAAHGAGSAGRFDPQLVNTGKPEWLPGEIHVVPDDFYLYFMLQNGNAIRYGVGVGRGNLYEAGTFWVRAKREWPRWTPTPDMIARDPEQYEQFKDGVPGGPNNPLGARALYLHTASGRDSYLRIHGTNAPRTIGSAVSNGCARLTNEYVQDLYPRVELGAKTVLYPKGMRP